MELAARPPARFSSLLNAPEITGTENKNQKENPFTQIPLQNLNSREETTPVFLVIASELTWRARP